MVKHKVLGITEERNPTSMKIDQMDAEEMLYLMNQEDTKVAEAVKVVIPAIGMAVDIITERMRKGGRLFYIGAGTSGRLGVLDAVECVPTFGIEADKVVAILAGGKEAMFTAQEGVEDDFEMGASEIKKYNLNNLDSTIGIAASGSTPYVRGAIDEANKRNAATICLVCGTDSELEKMVDVAIVPILGPEVLTGSTRLKAGTSQKMVLNMISTAIMIKLGKVYSNLMIDVSPNNCKLRIRAERIFMAITEASHEIATEYLSNSMLNVKAAVVMYIKGVSLKKALRLLEEKEGILGRVID